jgi:AraC family transcriptional regulator of adaptative response/methylated-DNA-[protein]-cysteine methyltransferase
MNPKMTPGKAVEEKRWRAICDRDRRFDDDFVFAVTTTKIYCRASCPARRPKRKNALFFDKAVGAERAGFRACKRCHPNTASIADRNVAAIRHACKLIEEAPETPRTSELALAIGMSVSHFHRQFKELVGVTPKEYGAGRRVKRLQDKLYKGGRVTEAIYHEGYGSSSRAYATAKSTLGMTHSKYRSGASGMTIEFVTTKTSLGWLLVAASDEGICCIEIGDTKIELQESVVRRFPAASIAKGSKALEKWISIVANYVELPARGIDLPLHIKGTAFQRRVWRALQDIPIGETRSYTEVATSIGEPKAVRAVAQACGANAIALAIPCHRVVRTDGSLGGYRWGTDRKTTLLQREQEVSTHSRRRVRNSR